LVQRHRHRKRVQQEKEWSTHLIVNLRKVKMISFQAARHPRSANSLLDDPQGLWALLAGSLSIVAFVWPRCSVANAIILLLLYRLMTSAGERRLLLEAFRHGSCSPSDRGVGAGAGCSGRIGVLLLPRQAFERRPMLPLHRSAPLDQFIKAVSDPTSARARRSAWAAGTALTVRPPTDQASLVRAETGTIAPRSDVRSLFPICGN